MTPACPNTRRRAEFRVAGMHCAHEVDSLNKALDGLSGVLGRSFDLVGTRMIVDFDCEVIDTKAIQRAVRKAGMAAEEWHEDPPEPVWRRAAPWALTAISGSALTAGLALDAANHASQARWLYLAAILGGAVFLLPRALRSIAALRADMNFLMTVSIAGALILGEWSEGASVAFLYALSHLLEAWSVDRARQAVSSLIRMTPSDATLITSTGERRVKAAEVHAGSLIRVAAGEHIPCDGEVIAGQSEVDESPVTGEPKPMRKAAADSVLAGSMNGSGALEIRTTSAPGDTTLARMARAVRDAHHNRAPVEQWVERFARVYTPAVITLAIAIACLPPLAAGGAWSHWIYQGLVTLLIACPCALVVSTPVAIVAALTSAARHGVLIKGGVYLETAARVTAVAVDDSRLKSFDNIAVELLPPKGQGERVREMTAKYGPTAVIGDGVNDAAAMAAGALGIAAGGKAVDVALETAGVVFLSDSPSHLPFLIRHSKRALRVIQQNVALALATKALFLILALFGKATLWMAIAADSGAALLVILSGLRLLRP